VIDYVRIHAERFGVEPILAVLNEHGAGIAPSTYYAHAAAGFGPTDAELRQAYLANQLRDLWTANRRLYGRQIICPSR
jgi:putative transposase